MRQVFQRAVSIFLTLVFILSAFITGTYSYQSLQTVTNETAATIIQVRLQKLEKLPDGTETDVPVSGAAFYLFSADGEQIGGSLTTDDAGEIIQRLPAGSYYFENLPRRRRSPSIRKTVNSLQNIRLSYRKTVRSL